MALFYFGGSSDLSRLTLLHFCWPSPSLTLPPERQATLIGNRIVNLAMRASSPWLQLGGFAAAIVASLTAAIALWYFVERPSHLRARVIKSAPSTAGLARGAQS